MIKSLAPPRIHHKMLFSTEKKKKSDISLEHIESLNKHSNVLVIGSDEDDESTLYRLNGSDARRTPEPDPGARDCSLGIVPEV